MKIAIVGAGALGCAIGGALHEGGSTVWLINRQQAHIDAINNAGLTLVTPTSERTLPITAVTACDGVGVVDLVIVLVKSFHTREAIQQAIPLVGEQTVVLSLQNGLGHEEILAEVVGHKRVIAGKTYVGGVLLGPGRVQATTAGKATIIGELDGSISERITTIAATFTRAGLTTTVSDNIVGAMWDKLLINVATGALTGITGLTYGELYQLPEVQTTALAAVAEAIAVAHAAGIRLTISEPEVAWQRAAAGLPPSFKTSLLQSLEKGSVTEIDFINGAVVREGLRRTVATPVNRTLVACVKGIERRIYRG